LQQHTQNLCAAHLARGLDEGARLAQSRLGLEQQLADFSVAVARSRLQNLLQIKIKIK